MTENKEYKLATPLVTRLHKNSETDWLVTMLDSDGILVVTEELGSKNFAYLALRTFKAIVTLVNNSARYREALEKVMAMEEKEWGDGFGDDCVESYQDGQAVGYNNCLKEIKDIIAPALKEVEDETTEKATNEKI